MSQENFSDFPIVDVENGPVMGLKAESVLGQEFYSFRGIPYMKPPLGKLRFREAQTPKDWTEPFDATREAPSYCMTDFMTGVQDGQENAGVINVYSRDLKPEKLKPVMIWVSSRVKVSVAEHPLTVLNDFRSTAVHFLADRVERICTDRTTSSRKTLCW
jgi:Carboxylesterase family